MPYVGDMSPEEYDRMMERYKESIQMKNVPTPEHFLLKIQTFDRNGENTCDTGPFDESRLNYWIGSVECSVCNTCADDIGFAVYEWDKLDKKWFPYKPDGKREMIFFFYRFPDGTIGHRRAQLCDLLPNKLKDRLIAAGRNAVSEDTQPIMKHKNDIQL